MGSNIPNWTYTPDGEGRVNTVHSSIGTQQNPVTATSYNGFSEPTAVTLGSADSDAFQYDANTGRMTQYKATINGSAVSGTLTWNANWTLGTLAITDNLNSADTQTCTYGYDSLARLSSDSCGSVWSQTFTYDAFGNISKSGSQSFGPTYSASTNRFTAIGSVTPTYDSNGNLTYDGFYNYTWDGEGNLATLGGNAETYDALDRRVEQYNGSAYTEIVYGPAGNKMALMSGQTVTKVFAPLSAGATAVYNSSGLSYYRHPDWLGSSRITSTTTRTLYYDGAYAPFGENYAETGTTDRSFTGQNQDLTPGSTGDLYDFLYREYHKIQGRWISPDPAGLGAVNPANPQSWNRYAYVLNNPLALADLAGLDCVYINDDGSIESIDQHIDSAGCTSDGGYWVEGTVIQYEIDDYGNYVFSSLVGPTNNPYVVSTTFLNNSNTGSSSVFDLFGTYGFNFEQQRFTQQPGLGGLQQSASSEAAMKAIAAQLPTVCGGGFFINGGPAAGQGGVHGGYHGFVEFDSNNNFRPAVGTMKEVQVGPLGFGQLSGSGGQEPVIFGDGGPGGVIFFPASGAAGGYAGTPELGAGAYANFTTVAGCASHN